jgi:hypothetical protein
LAEDVNPDAMHHEVENRLDALFGDAVEAKVAPAGKATPSAMSELKSLVMSIEWEITDDLMDRFLAIVETLKQTYRSDRILLMFLQLLGSLGLYVKTNKGKAHPNAFGLLTSVHTSFDNAVRQDKMPPAQKKKLLYVELNKYKELKEIIENAKNKGKRPPEASRGTPVGTTARVEAVVPPGESKARAIAGPKEDSRTREAPPAAAEDPRAPVTRAELRAALEDMRRYVDGECRRLREELRAVKKA